MANDAAEKLIQELRELDKKEQECGEAAFAGVYADVLERALPIIKAQAALEEHERDCAFCVMEDGLECPRAAELRAIIAGGQSGQ